MKDYYYRIYNESKKELFELLSRSLKNHKKEFVITANAEIIMSGLKSKQVDGILKNKNIIITADGVSVIKTAKFF